MASVEKMWDANTGYQTGLHGPKRCTLPYRVTVDAVTDNPVDVIKLAGTGVPIGTYHPLDDSLVVVDYIIQERINPLNWRVDPIYDRPIVWTKLYPMNDGWALSGHSITETYPLYHTLERYGRDPKVIGMPCYRKAKPKELSSANGQAALQIFTVEGSPQIKLVRDDDKVISEPYEKRLPLMAFSLTRRFASLNASAIGAANTYVETVNIDLFPWVMADQYTVRFDAIDWNIVHSAASGTEHGIEWEIRLDFTYNSKGWTPIERYHMWIDDETGAQAFILDPRKNRIKEQFEVYELSSMNQLMSNFG